MGLTTNRNTPNRAVLSNSIEDLWQHPPVPQSTTSAMVGLDVDSLLMNASGDSNFTNNAAAAQAVDFQMLPAVDSFMHAPNGTGTRNLKQNSIMHHTHNQDSPFFFKQNDNNHNNIHLVTSSSSSPSISPTPSHSGSPLSSPSPSSSLVHSSSISSSSSASSTPSESPDLFPSAADQHNILDNNNDGSANTDPHNSTDTIILPEGVQNTAGSASGKAGGSIKSRAEIRRARAARNRNSARRSRLRKKAESERDKEKAELVEKRNIQLKKEVQNLQDQMIALQKVVESLGLKADPLRWFAFT